MKLIKEIKITLFVYLKWLLMGTENTRIRIREH